MMANDIPSYTSYPEVNITLHDLKKRLKLVFSKQLIGIYIHGSLAAGGFNRQRSDIDFLIVTSNEIHRKLFSDLQRMHNKIIDDHPEWGMKLEGSYITREKFYQIDVPCSPRPYLHNGHLEFCEYGPEWILERHVLREHGIVLEGPKPNMVIERISPIQIKKATLKFLYDWWMPMLKDTKRLADSEYQVYTVLTMCRVLYTLQTGNISSKETAAKWVISIYKQWSKLINQALKWEKEQTFNLKKHTVKFIKFTVRRSKQIIESKAITEDDLFK